MGKTSRPQPDDSEASSTKEKVPTHAGNTTNGKNRRAVTNATGAAANATSHLATSVLAAGSGSNPENAPGVSSTDDERKCKSIVVNLGHVDTMVKF
jgi:hypothetical protein